MNWRGPSAIDILPPANAPSNSSAMFRDNFPVRNKRFVSQISPAFLHGCKGLLGSMVGTNPSSEMNSLCRVIASWLSTICPPDVSYSIWSSTNSELWLGSGSWTMRSSTNSESSFSDSDSKSPFSPDPTSSPNPTLSTNSTSSSLSDGLFSPDSTSSSLGDKLFSPDSTSWSGDGLFWSYICKCESQDI